MANSHEHSYFPPLNECFTGDIVLISWAAAARALSDDLPVDDTSPLARFLASEEALQVLSDVPKPLAIPPSATSKSTFETKTAPIHLPQPVDDAFSIEDLKSDALWLSKEAQIEELTALRIAIVEWQDRSKRFLLDNGDGSSDSIRTASRLGSSVTARPTQGSNHAINTILDDFAKEPKRRERLVCILLEEIGAIFEIHADLLTSRAARNIATDVPRLTNGNGDWKATLADDVAERQYSNDGRKCQMYCRTRSVQFLRDLWAQERQSGPANVFTASHIRLQVYNSVLATKVTHTLRVLLACTTSLSQPLHADLVLNWFSLMDDFAFLQDEQQLSLGPQLSAVNCLVAMVSLAILQLHHTVTRLASIARASGDSDPHYPDLPGDGVTYFKDEACLKRINLVLHKAVTFEISVAAPAIYAWSIITAHLQALGFASSGRNEGNSGDVSPLSRRDPSGRRESLQPRSEWERLYDALMDPQLADARTDLPRFFADAAISTLRTYPLIASLAGNLVGTWTSKLSSGTEEIGRYILMSLIRAGMTWIVYGEEVLEALFAVLGEDSTGTSQVTHSRNLAKRFLDDHEVFRPMILDQALLRYPYELSPLLRLLTLLAAAPLERVDVPTEIIDMLETTNIFTVMVPVHFRAYRLESEDEGSNDMILTDTLPLFASKHLRSLPNSRLASTDLLKSNDSSRAAVTSVPAGTTGNIIREDHPRVLKLNHTHSTLAYLGFLLSSTLPGSELQPAALAPSMDRLTASEAVSLVNALMAPSTKQSSWHENARLVLYHCSSALDEEQDIVSVLGEIFEMELLAHVEQAAQEGSLELVTACACFFANMVSISPERIWALVSRSSLLGLNNGTSALAAVVAGTEVRHGRYAFLIACVRLYRCLIDDAITGLVKRKSTSAFKRGHRFDSPVENSDAVPDRVVRSVLAAYQRIMLDAFQNLSTWRFVDAREKVDIVESLMPPFTILLRATYGLHSCNDGDDQTSSMTGTLQPAAEMLLLSFVPQTGDGPLLQMLSNLFVDGFMTTQETSSSSLRQSSSEYIGHISRFTTSLVRTARLWSPEAAGLFASRFLQQSMLVFARLCATNSSTKAYICELLAELVEAMAQQSDETASILASMNHAETISYLQVLTQMDRPFTDHDDEVKIWHFLSSILSGRQQWFACYLLTGSLPRDRLLPAEMRENSFLTYALRQLSSISEVAPARAKAMLEFVKVAQIVWIRANGQVRNHSDFIANAISWLNDLHPPGRGANMAQTLLSADEYELAALLCDILAVNLQTGLEVGDLALLKQLRDRLAFLGQHAVNESLYNRSLHANLAENLRARYSGCNLSSFRRTAANLSSIGEDRVFDLKLADKILSHDAAWKISNASTRGRGQGFVDEFKRANANLSLVEAQAKLLKSWRALATSLCAGLEKEPSLQHALTQATEICLRADANLDLDEPGSAQALESRAELGFMLLSTLVAARCKEDGMRKLLLSAWELVRRSPADFEVASNDADLAYYRTLLRILYLAIQPHIYMQPRTRASPSTQSRPTDETELELLSPEIALCLVDIVQRAVAPGFRALCGNLHNNIRLAVPADFALLNGLLQAIFSVTGISAVYIQLAEVVANTSMVRGALSLFSWADRLADSTQQDPIYGEVAINMLTTLSAVRPVADEMAVNGALIQLSSANLADYFRKPGGKSPFSEPLRMFSIWTDGFLPICLNLLDAVGPPVTAQVATFLNSFPEQLGRAASALQQQVPRSRDKSRQGDITLGAVSEAHSLIMISLVLEADAARAAAEGINATDIPRLALDIKGIREQVEVLVRNQRSLAERVVPVTEREAAWAKTSVPDSNNTLLVERVLVELRDACACFGERVED